MQRGIDDLRAAPVLWRVLAHNPHYIEATWRKERALMADGALSAHDKRRTALGVVDHCTTLNTFSEGMQIELDIRPFV